LIDDLLDVSRIITGKLQIEPRTVDLRNVIETAIEAVATQSPSYDGDGGMLRETTGKSTAPGTVGTAYYLKSSALGGKVIEELDGNGQKAVGYVYTSSGQRLATQSNGQVTWKHATPAGTTEVQTFATISGSSRLEFDPLGADVSLAAPPSPPIEGPGDIGAGHFAGILDQRYSDMFNLSGGCKIDHMAASCSLAMAGGYLDASFQAVRIARYATGTQDGQVVFRGYIGSYYVPVEHMTMDVMHSQFEYNAKEVQQNGGQVTTSGFYAGILGAKFSTESGPDTFSDDVGTHDLTSAYNVRIFGGAQYFSAAGAQQKPGVEFLPLGDSYGEKGEKLIGSIIDSLKKNERCKRAFKFLDCDLSVKRLTTA